MDETNTTNSGTTTEATTIVTETVLAPVETTANTAPVLSTLASTHPETFYHRLSVFTKAFEVSIVHGVDAAVSAAKKAVEAFDEMFGK